MLRTPTTPHPASAPASASRHRLSDQALTTATNAKGFEVLPRRWVVERTFAWIFKNRRLVRDYEQLTAVAETLITIAASATLLRRWP
jgi:transposase